MNVLTLVVYNKPNFHDVKYLYIQNVGKNFPGLPGKTYVMWSFFLNFCCSLKASLK